MNTLFKALVLFAFTVNGVAETKQPHPKVKLDFNPPHKLTCDFEDVIFNSNYETGRISSCEKLASDHYLISTYPENKPINPSPWYGFSVTSNNENAKQIIVEIQADNSRPRYLPKLSSDKAHWEPMNFEVVQGNLILSMTVGANKSVQYVSAQEIIDNAMYQQWNKKIADNSSFELQTIGESVEGRNIDALIHTQPDNTEWLFIVGRQHPPEITGALALLNFVEALLGENTANTQLFERFNILIVPLVNPDGVAAGNWRHNSNGIDLNRDWGRFTQPETRVVHNKLGELMRENHKLVFALDFHSTQQDIFYTMPTDYIPIKHKRLNIEKGVMPNLFVEEWLSDLKQETVRSFTVRDRPGSSPGRGVFKQFIADEYGVHAVTYELGDNTNRQLIKHTAKASADTLVNKLLNTDASQFKIQ